MKKGDLVQAVGTANGDAGESILVGDLGLVLGPAENDFNISRGCLSVMFAEIGRIDCHPILLETVDDV